MASFDPALYDPARAMVVNRNGTLVPGSGDRYNGMVRAGDGVPAEELFRVPNGDDPAVLAVPAGAPRGFYRTAHLFAPRLSFAWTPTGSGEHGGARRRRPLLRPPGGQPAVRRRGQRPGEQPALRAQLAIRKRQPLGAGRRTRARARARWATIAAIDPDLKVPRSWNWSLSVQRELPWGIFGEVGYVGSQGQNLLRQPDINQPSFDDLGANAALPAAAAREHELPASLQGLLARS